MGANTWDVSRVICPCSHGCVPCCLWRSTRTSKKRREAWAAKRKDKANKTFCDSASSFRCFADRIEYTQHVGVDDCSAGAILTVNTSVHIKCTQSRNHEGVIYHKLVNYSGC